MSNLPKIPNEVIDSAVTRAEELMKVEDALTALKYEGLSSLDDFGDIVLLFGTTMFQLGVEHANKGNK